MSADLTSIAADDDTGRIRTAATKGPTSDPARELTGLEVGLIAHEQADARRFASIESHWRLVRTVGGVVGGILLSLAAWGAEQAWEAHAAAARGAAQIDDMHERIVRMESQLDRLMERSADR